MYKLIVYIQLSPRIFVCSVQMGVEAKYSEIVLDRKLNCNKHVKSKKQLLPFGNLESRRKDMWLIIQGILLGLGQNDQSSANICFRCFVACKVKIVGNVLTAGSRKYNWMHKNCFNSSSRGPSKLTPNNSLHRGGSA